MDALSDSLCIKLIKGSIEGRKIYVYGAGRSGYIGRAFLMRLVQSGFKAFFIGDASVQMMDEGDIIVIISGSGKIAINNMLSVSKKLNLEIVMITSNNNDPIDEVDLQIGIPGRTKMENDENEEFSLPLASYFEINSFIFCECLVAKIIDKSPEAKKCIETVGERYQKGEMIVI